MSQKLLRLQALRALQLLQTKCVSIPQHLERNVALHRKDPKAVGHQDRWPIHVHDRLVDVLSNLCRLKKTEEIAANLLYHYLKTTDQSIQGWRRTQEGTDDEMKRSAMLCEFNHEFRGLLQQIFPTTQQHQSSYQHNGEYLFGLLNPEILKIISPDLRPAYRKSMKLNLLESFRSFFCSSPFSIYAVNWSILVEVVGTSQFLPLMEAFGLPIVYLPKELKALRKITFPQPSETEAKLNASVIGWLAPPDLLRIPSMSHNRINQISRLSSPAIDNLFSQCLNACSPYLLFPGIRLAIQLAHAHHRRHVNCSFSPFTDGLVEVFSLGSRLSESSWSLSEILLNLVERRSHDEFYWFLAHLPSFDLLLESINIIKSKDPITGKPFLTSWTLESLSLLRCFCCPGSIIHPWGFKQIRHIVTVSKIGYEFYERCAVIVSGVSASHDVDSIIRELYRLIQWIPASARNPDWLQSSAALTSNHTVQSLANELVELQHRIALLSSPSSSCLLFSCWFRQWIQKCSPQIHSQQISLTGQYYPPSDTHHPSCISLTRIKPDCEVEEQTSSARNRADDASCSTNTTVSNHHPNEMPRFNKSRRFTSSGQAEWLLEQYILNLTVQLTSMADSFRSFFGSKGHQNCDLIFLKNPLKTTVGLDIAEVFDMLDPVIRERIDFQTKMQFGNLDYSALIQRMEEDTGLGDVQKVYNTNDGNEFEVPKNNVDVLDEDSCSIPNVSIWSEIVSTLPLIERPNTNTFRSRSVKEITEQHYEDDSRLLAIDSTLDLISTSGYSSVQASALLPVSLCFEPKTDKRRKRPLHNFGCGDQQKINIAVLPPSYQTPSASSSLLPLHFPLNDKDIKWISNYQLLSQMMNVFHSRTIDIVGIDIEWTPPSLVSLLTIAAPSIVFCIDFKCLDQDQLFHGALLNFLLWLFANPHILKVSHRFQIDYTRLLVSLLTDDVLANIISSEIQSLPQLYPDPSRFNRRVFLTRFLGQSTKNVIDLSNPRIWNEIRNPNQQESRAELSPQFILNRRLLEAIESGDPAKMRAALSEYENNLLENNQEWAHHERSLEWPSLQSLIQEVFPGYYLDRHLEASNWDTRPLLAPQLRFASLDALILIIIESALRAKGLKPSIVAGREGGYTDDDVNS